MFARIVFDDVSSLIAHHLYDLILLLPFLDGHFCSLVRRDYPYFPRKPSHAAGALAGVLVGGAGMELNSTVCNLGVLSCIIFYATSKLFIYLFLGEYPSSAYDLVVLTFGMFPLVLFSQTPRETAEKVYVVWSPTPGRPRFRSPVYLTCFFVVMLYLVVGVNMIYGAWYPSRSFE